MTTVALTIAGSDSGGGAGIQADLKTFQELNVFGTSAITAVTAQNTLGVHGVYALETDAVTSQIRSVMDDFNVNAIKTGMLFSSNIIEAIAGTLKTYPSSLLVIDPVMIAKGGASLLLNEAVIALKSTLLPLATCITPNIPEAEVLTGMTIITDADILKAAQKILDMGAHSVVMKGGHLNNSSTADDLFLSTTGEQFILRSKRIHTKDTHGTGCTFSAAITAHLAHGRTLTEAVTEAKYFIQAALMDGLSIGNGNGPTNHWAYNQSSDFVREDVLVIE